jgi:hypothetical protein
MKKLLPSSTLLRTALLACASSALFAISASAQTLIVNGSFEANSVGTNFDATTNPNNSTFTGWTVATTSGLSQFYVADTTGDSGGFPDAIHGNNYLAFNSNDSTAGVGLLYQDFATVVGNTYTVSFWVGRADAGASVPVGLQANVYNVLLGTTDGDSLGTASATEAFSGSYFFANPTFDFVATGSTSRLLFSDISQTTQSVDALLDNVSVTLSASAVPEPSTYAALAGAAVLGLAMWKRRKSALPAVAAV